MNTKQAITLRQAFVNLGYTKMDNNESFWGKPVGFGIIIAEIKGDVIEIKTMFRDVKSEPNIWASSVMNINEIAEGVDGEELYNKFVFNIAYKEFESKAEKLFFPFAGDGSKPFDIRHF